MSEKTIQFEDEAPRSIDDAGWRSIYWRLMKLRPEDRGEKRVTMTSRTKSHASESRMVNKTFGVSDRVFKNTKIAVGNIERRK